MAFGLADEGPIAVRVLGREPCALAKLLQARIAAAEAWRQRVVPARTNTYRLINGAGDGLPGLVADRYAELLVLRLYSAAWEPHLGAVLDALAPLDWAESIARRLGVGRVDGAEGIKPLSGAPPAERLVVEECGLLMIARPAAGQKTGLFLDQRENRRLVGRWSAGLRVVNLFGYSGGFSLHAAAGGARRTVTVDLAEDALRDARENFALNGFDPGAHEFVRGDAFRWKPGRPADLVICDPPSLARAAAAVGAARKAYRELNAHAAAMVAAPGILVTASCTARMREDRWLEAVRKGMARVSGSWCQVHAAAEPADHPVALGHPEGRYLKLAAFRRQAH